MITYREAKGKFK